MENNGNEQRLDEDIDISSAVRAIVGAIGKLEARLNALAEAVANQQGAIESLQNLLTAAADPDLGSNYGPPD